MKTTDEKLISGNNRLRWNPAFLATNKFTGTHLSALSARPSPGQGIQRSRRTKEWTKRNPFMINQSHLMYRKIASMKVRRYLFCPLKSQAAPGPNFGRHFVVYNMLSRVKIQCKIIIITHLKWICSNRHYAGAKKRRRSRSLWPETRHTLASTRRHQISIYDVNLIHKTWKLRWCKLTPQSTWR